jgi:cytoskeletal protein CcmA (bactofilin family)
MARRRKIVVPPAPPEREDPSFVEHSLRTVLYPGSSVAGKLSFDHPVKIDSRFKGEVRSSALLVLGPKAEIEAKILARHLRVEGSLVGSVQVDGWIEILSGGRFRGEIQSGKLKVYPGGIFEGKGEVSSSQPPSSS